MNKIKYKLCENSHVLFCFSNPVLLGFPGKGPSIWDDFAHEGGHIYMNNSGDIAADGYGHYLEDIRLIKSLKVNT